MQNTHRKTAARVSALILALMLIFSFTASYAAASFKPSGAGVRYGGKSFKLNSSTTPETLQKVFGKWSSRKVDDACTFGFASYLYTFKSKGIVIETYKKKEKDKKEKIIGIVVTNAKIPTVTGLKIGDKTSTLAKKYGTDCAKLGSRVLYKSGKYLMRISTKKKEITKIEFLYDL